MRHLIGRMSGPLLVLAGLAFLVPALAQPVKGWLGHTLLDRTFASRLQAASETQADPDEWRPWPGADLSPIAELYFPELDERRVVADSVSGEALAWSVGHVTGTAAPGEAGISAIAGHRDGRFSMLQHVNRGDVFELTTLDGTTTSYVVEDRHVVDSNDVELPIDHLGPEQLILTTCWPIDAFITGPERLLVSARPLA